MRRSVTFLVLCVTLTALLAVLVPAAGAQEEPVTITYWDWWVTQSPAIDATIAAFEEAYPNIRVEKSTQADYENLLNLAFESGNAPDVYMLRSSPALSVMVDNNRVMAWNGFEDYQDFMAQFPESRFLEGVNVLGGNVYSVDPFVVTPWLQLYVNLDLYEEAGLVDANGDPMLPATLDEMIANARTIREQTGKYGFGFSGTQDWATWWWLWGCQFTEPIFFDGSPGGWNPVTGQFEWGSNQCVADLIDSLIMMRDEGLTVPDTMMIDDEQARAMFAEGEFAHLIGGTWIMPGWAQTHPDFTNYTAIHFPLVNADDFGGYFYTSGAGQFLAINPQTQHPQEAWEFYKFMHSETFGRNWAETGNGMTLATPGTAEDYAAFTPAWQNIFAMADLMRISPQPRVRNPDTASVEVTLVGPWEGQILLGALTGQIDDVQAALDDLDQRSMEALELGIADAQAAGLNVSLEDYMFPNWNPTENYTGN